MFLTRFLLNPENPAAFRDITNEYGLHQTIAHLDTPSYRALWRREESRSPMEPVSILAQTEREPNLNLLEDDSAILYVLHATIRRNRLLENLRQDRIYRFLLRANPTSNWSDPNGGKAKTGRRTGKRIPFDVQRNGGYESWLVSRLEKAGAEVHAGSLLVSEPRTVKLRKRTGRHTITLMQVDFSGVLLVRDAEVLRTAVTRGIGPAKAFGFGLLTLAPA
jgi:CRISPR system Cascade subunit CasE